MRARPRVLIISGDTLYRDTLLVMVTRAHYAATVATTVDEARALLVADERLLLILWAALPAGATSAPPASPSILPAELIASLAELRRIRPALATILITAQPLEIIPLPLLDYGVHFFFTTPDSQPALRAVLQLVLTCPHLAQQATYQQVTGLLLYSLEPVLASLERATIIHEGLRLLLTWSGAREGNLYLRPEPDSQLVLAASQKAATPLTEQPGAVRPPLSDLSRLSELELAALVEGEHVSRPQPATRVLLLGIQERTWGMVQLVAERETDLGPQTLAALTAACSQLARALHTAETCHNLRENCERLDSAHQLQQSILEQLPYAVLVCDTEGQILAANDAFEATSGYALSQLLHMNLRSRVPGALEQVLIAIRAHENALYQGALYAKDGRQLGVELHVGPLQAGSRVQGGILLVRDLYEVRRTYDAMIRNEKLRALDELANGVAHNVNNRLAVILGRAQLAMRQAQDKELRRDLEAIVHAAKASAELIQRLQTSTALDSDQQHLEDVDINVLVGDVLKDIRLRLQNEAQRIGHPIEIVEDLTPVLSVFGNRDELCQVLTNVIANARDAMPTGGTITIATRQWSGWVAIRITDTGIGMSEQIKQRAFDPLFTTKGPQSTGLGLTIAYGIVARYGGDIEVESSVGRGTNLIIRLPIKQPSMARPTGVLTLEHARHVLVVDDERDICQMLEKLLSAEGYAVTVALDGPSALTLFKQGNYQLVITDLGLPGMSGWELAQALFETNPETPILAITGWGVIPREEELRQCHVRELIYKPFGTGTLLNAVNRSLGTAE